MYRHDMFCLEDKKDSFRFLHRVILFKWCEIPDMYPEYSPGPSDDDPFPDFYNTGIEVFIVDTENNTCKELSVMAMQKFYRYIHGRRDRITYHRVMKYLTHCQKVTKAA
jgi:hypothetical protein